MFGLKWWVRAIIIVLVLGFFGYLMLTDVSLSEALGIESSSLSIAIAVLFLILFVIYIVVQARTRTS